jgi:multiple sugar transport system substrate-binding protein
MRALLIAILTLGLLSGANTLWSRARQGNAVEVELSVWGMPFENSLYVKEYLPQFERENPGIRVRFHHFDSYQNRILLMHAGRIAPDVMRQNTIYGAQYLRRGMNLPLDRYIDGSDGIDRDDFIPVIWNSLRWHGRTYGLPQDINIRGLYFNRDLFAAAGVAPPDERWTWSDLNRAAERLTVDADRDGNPESIGLLCAWRALEWLPFYYQAGGELWDVAKRSPRLDNAVAVDSLRFFRGLKRGYMLTQASSERGGLGPHTFFQMGKAAMLIDGTWRAPQLKKSAPGLHFGVAPLPRGARAMSISTSCYWAISAHTRHPREAWKLAKFLSGTEQLVRYWQYLWVAPPARWSSLRSPGFRQVTGAGPDNPGLSSQAEFREKCGWIPRCLERAETTTEFIGPFTNQLLDRLNFAVEDVLLQSAEPGPALRQAQRETEDAIREAEKTFVE